VAQLAVDAASGRLRHDVDAGLPDVRQPGRPGRPPLVEPARVPRRRLGSEAGRAAFVHAIAHIEFNAINLALDAVCRFRDMPPAYYQDWLTVAADEARHFSLLRDRLAELGHQYGDFPAHSGLWDMAERTADSCLARMALVPRVLEARGLDVTPGMITRLRQLGDSATVDVLEIILAEEIGHVATGSRWFHYCCNREGREPEATFLRLLDTRYSGMVRGPLNREARLAAGFTHSELAALQVAAGDSL
jgi:uncharacterized ferritin-like protein (DUF455 family)